MQRRERVENSQLDRLLQPHAQMIGMAHALDCACAPAPAVRCRQSGARYSRSPFHIGIDIVDDKDPGGHDLLTSLADELPDRVDKHGD